MRDEVMCQPLFRRLMVTSVAAAMLLLAACGAPASAQQTDTRRATDLLNAGLRAHAAGRLAEAAGDYHQALTYDPHNVWAYYNLGVVDQTGGNLQAAERDYRSALAIDPNFLGALYNLAIVRTGNAPLEAVDLYRHAMSVAPNNANIHLNLGFLLMSLGQQVEARAELNKAVALNPAYATRLPATPAPSPTKKP
jgi:tetratricopeptide (TPR) repeat protein